MKMLQSVAADHLSLKFDFDGLTREADRMTLFVVLTQGWRSTKSLTTLSDELT